MGEVENMSGLRDAVVDGARRRVAQAPAVATIGRIIEPLDATPASAVKSTGISLLDRNLGGGLPSGSVVISLRRSGIDVRDIFTPVHTDTQDVLRGYRAETDVCCAEHTEYMA